MPEVYFSEASLDTLMKVVAGYCSSVSIIAASFSDEEKLTASSLTKRFVDLRQQRLLPYLVQLTEKAVDGHDCATCSGKCDIGHSLYLTELRHSLDEMDKALQQITQPEHYILKSLLIAVMRFEIRCLVPAISRAQREINAGN